MDPKYFTLMRPFFRAMETNISGEWTLIHRGLLMTLFMTLLLVTLKTVDYSITNLYWPMKSKGDTSLKQC